MHLRVFCSLRGRSLSSRACPLPCSVLFVWAAGGSLYHRRGDENALVVGEGAAARELKLVVQENEEV